MVVGEESPLSSLVFPVLIRPVLTQLERERKTGAQTMRAALTRVEACLPGFTCELVGALVRRAELPVNMHESILRLHSADTATSDMDAEYRLMRTEEPFQELNRKSANLKRILARIPAEITDRKTFLETIKEIASAIKKLLDAVQGVSGYIPGSQGKQALDARRKEFVRYSKKFSNTLKDYFKEGQSAAVFISANCLIYYTNMIVVTVKSRCE